MNPSCSPPEVGDRLFCKLSPDTAYPILDFDFWELGTVYYVDVDTQACQFSIFTQGTNTR